MALRMRAPTVPPVCRSLIDFLPVTQFLKNRDVANAARQSRRPCVALSRWVRLYSMALLSSSQAEDSKDLQCAGERRGSSLTASGNGEADPECLQLASRACAADVRFRARNVDIRLAVTCGSRGNRVRVGARGASATP